MNIFIAILALSVLVLVHEFGHFIVAKLCDIKVCEFSIFMGPKLFSVKKGETEYSLRLIPIGGYIKMEGEEEESSDARAFNKKSVGQRAAVIAAGPIMNILIAIILITIVFSIVGYVTPEIDLIAENSPVINYDIQPGDKVIAFNGKKVYNPMDINILMYGSASNTIDITVQRDGTPLNRTVTLEPRYIIGFTAEENTNVVQSVTPGSPAEKANLKVGDKIYKINNTEVTSVTEIQKLLKANVASPVDVFVNRGENEVVLKGITPMEDTKGVYYDLGMYFKNQKGGLFKTIGSAVNYSISIIRTVFYSFGWLFSGRVSMNEMSGPVGIVSTIGNVVEQSRSFMDALINLLGIASFISLNLGVFNLFPFPALDGSKLLLLLVEKVRKKPIPVEKEAMISMVGFVLLMMLLVFTLYNDISKLVR